MNNDDRTEDDVLLAYSVEPTHDLATLERYLLLYPQFAEGLIDCSIEEEVDRGRTRSPVTPLSQSSIAWKRFEAAMGLNQPVTFNPFGKLDSRAFRLLATELDMNSLLLMRLRDRVIKASTIPRQLVGMIADKLGVGADSIQAYFQGAPTVALGGAQFKSAVKPTAAPQIDFAEAVRTSQLSEDQTRRLLEQAN